MFTEFAETLRKEKEEEKESEAKKVEMLCKGKKIEYDVIICVKFETLWNKSQI